MLNKVILMGRLTRDPEYKTSPTGLSIVNFSVAVDRDVSAQNGEKETDFIDCVAWRKTAEFITKYFLKGSMIALCGRLQIRIWTDKDGNRRKSAEVVVDSAYFAGSKTMGSSPIAPAPPVPAASAANFSIIEGPDERLPF